uniref:Electron transfer flavoprotein subunit alpha n=1 Tax=Pyramimonas obovata TaxID=1411642 RepID=A0A7S0N3L6_9CHLO|eukprot:CAMPEP_0118953510 /NCGR_PEP_ID=MMETSP1169-20130426/56692_1 /TAXON_ID=36882 /ORGANISM="Pyramimonas obovata, Strain CCMP722" /LENGTH=366 /DNA_ID=CAMNT_0006900989 /DNA_START=78 /DNA_END=1178 /DNA_ORIENTATION=-
MWRALWGVSTRAHAQRATGPMGGVPCLPATINKAVLFSTQTSKVSTLVVAEHAEGSLKSASLSAVSAAQELGGEVHILVAGTQLGGVVEAARKLQGVGKVLTAESNLLENSLLAEPMAELLSAIAHRMKYTHFVAPATTFGKNLLPRTAALLDTSPLNDVSRIIDSRTFVRPIYAGDALATVSMADTKEGVPICLTVRSSSFTPASAGSGHDMPPIEECGEAAALTSGGSEFVSREVTTSERPELSTARVVVAGGRALKTKANFEVLGELADQLGGAVGATRAAVDMGLAANDLQVGQTGKVVAPELYFAVGISGAIQHTAGMQDSKTIVAINSDPEAPIFKVADYGLVADLFEVLPELSAKLPKK